ncbi:MAG: glycosyltransferase [Planctomycetes bacterium]|nr:glycosyltransferase [Planctomycetota bacterium]
MPQQKQRKRRIFVGLFTVMTVCASVYLVVRAILLTMGNLGTWSMVLAALLLLAESFVVFQAVAYALNVSQTVDREAIPRKDFSNWDEAPPVAILLPARHEPYDVLDKTLTAISNIDYPNKTIFFLDDSSEEKYQHEAEQLADEYGAVLFQREDRHGAKAGVLNDVIEQLDEKYKHIAVFDSDQEPMPAFLKRLVPVMEANDRLGLVQTPQFYTNIDASYVSAGANLQHCMFYEYICEGKSSRGAMMCCGTNFLLRREAIEDSGGFDESSVTEDFATSLDLLVHGWQSVYYNEVLAFGEAPETLSAFLKQQSRWASGNLQVLKKVIRTLVTHPLKLTVGQWWEFLTTGTYYLTGWAYLVLMICPIAYVFFGVPTFFMEPTIYVLTFVPYFALSLGIFFTSMERRYYTPGKLVEGILLGFAALPVYIKSAVGALFGVKTSFLRTQKAGATETEPLWYFWPQTVLWLANFAALVWGANILGTGLRWPLAVSMIWITYHFFIFSGFLFFRNMEPEKEYVKANPQ